MRQVRRRLAVVALATVVMSACDPGEPDPAPAAPDRAEKGTASPAFTEIAREAGLDFVHENGMTGKRYLVEIMGPGVGLIDYDRDGDLDVYLVQGGPLETAGDASDRLFRNDLVVRPDGGRTLRFTDVTGASGIVATEYGMGVAVGDYDDDGFPDLYVTNFGPNRLWRNRGDGTFEDVTAASRAGDERWSVAASFFDADADGDLDLYVGNYVDFTLATNRECFRGVPDYCSPSSYRAAPDRLLENLGDGTFRDVTAVSGLGRAFGNGLGAVAADLDADGDADLYVANDGNANQLWRNRGDGTFEDVALVSGCALNDTGMAEAGMGVDAGDFDADGDLDLFLSHLRGQTNTLYANDSTGAFVDATIPTGLGPPSAPFTGFGTAWFDAELDGDLDLFVANGAVNVVAEQARRGEPLPLRERDQLFRNRGDGTFEDATAAAGPALERVEIGRGTAFGDLDNDGDTDLVVANNAGPVRVLRNDGADGAGWVGVRVIGPSGRDMLGARVEFELADGSRRVRRAAADGSYASASDPRVVAGFGRGDVPERVDVVVTWPGGARERFASVPTGAWNTLARGSGDPE